MRRQRRRNKNALFFSAAKPTDQGEESVVLLLVIVVGGGPFSNGPCTGFLGVKSKNFSHFSQKVFPFSHPFSKDFPQTVI